MNAFEIEEYLNGILEPWNFEDFCFNGIQIEGSRNVKKVALGVSFNLAFVEKAIGWNADMLLVHHGIFGKDFFKLRGYLKKRVEKVLENGLTLMGYHLPLDAHPEYGNNALITKALGLEIEESFDVGYIGSYNTPIETSTFLNKLSELLNRKDLLSYVNRPVVQKVCVISGGGANDIFKLEGKADTFITGEVQEYVRDLSREMQLNFINAGHYSTETFGVKKLGKLLEENLGLETQFFDIYNEV